MKHVLHTTGNALGIERVEQDMRAVMIFIAMAAIGSRAEPQSSDLGATSIKRAEYRKLVQDHGQCMLEVEVDRAAEVEIRGDMARLRTIGGKAAQWRRFECNAPLPQNPEGFRFRGVDGRGEQQLMREPWGDRGAVILIDDPKDGREGYTFSIEWGGLQWAASRQRT